MLHLRRCILARQLVSSPAASRISHLHRLLSAAAPASPISHLHRRLSTAVPAVSPSPRFNGEEYLVATCGLTRAQALKASAKLSHVKSPTNPDAVLAYLAGLGLSSADIAALVAKDPLFLCTSVERTLAPNVAGLTGLGLSHTEITRLLMLVPFSFRKRSIVSNLPYGLMLFGSYEKLLRAIKRGSYLLSADLENRVKPTVTCLQECGLPVCDIAKLLTNAQRILGTTPERLRLMVACAEGLGVPRGSAMFRHALHAVGLLSEEKIAAQVENLKNTFGWSDAEVRHAVSKLPFILRYKDNLQTRSEFLISEVGLEPAYIAHRPALLSYSLEGRLRPRYYVVKFLKENGLLDHDRDYYAAVVVTEKVFVEKYIYPYKNTAPLLAEDYADACRGQVSARFRFALTKDGL